MSSLPKVCVVGCGHWGKNLARNFFELGALGAITDPHPPTLERVSSEFSVPGLSFEDAISSSVIDAVVIASPAELHAPLAIKAFQAGKHVYVEKPLALSMDDGLAIKSASLKAGKVLMVGHLLQYHPAFIALLDLVKSGRLGEIRYAYSNRLSLGRFRIEENALWSFAPHDISMLLAIFGGEIPQSVNMSGGSYLTDGIEDEVRLDMHFADGRHAHVFSSWLHPFKEQRLVVIGTEAMAVFEDHLQGAQKLRLYNTKIDTSGAVPVGHKGEEETIPFEASEPLKNECQHFLDAIMGKCAVRTDADEALRVLKVLTSAV
jgi:predicted dehydrogenase